MRLKVSDFGSDNIVLFGSAVSLKNKPMRAFNGVFAALRRAVKSCDVFFQVLVPGRGNGSEALPGKRNVLPP